MSLTKNTLQKTWETSQMASPKHRSRLLAAALVALPGGGTSEAAVRARQTPLVLEDEAIVTYSGCTNCLVPGLTRWYIPYEPLSS